ncbi:MAG: methylmalonyl-CoA mutase, partial [Planctomycetes bacterium]|nr:methylmalonyl-CoA mutase [Planctomycetota bacterium]
PDPLAGSYLVEQLTDELEQKASELITKVDDRGGSIGAIEQKFMQGEIARAALQYQRAVEKGDAVVVGVNKFQTQNDIEPQLLQIDAEAAQKQQARLAEFRAQRDDKAVADGLYSLQEAAKGDENLVPKIINALRAKATLGEVCDTMRGVFGEYRDS